MRPFDGFGRWPGAIKEGFAMKWIGNIFWLIFFGWWLCLMHIATGIAQCISIIGIPVGIANFKIAAIALWPVGRRGVSVETAQAAREANARRRFQ